MYVCIWWENFTRHVRFYFSRWDRAEKLERLTANAEVATVLGSIPATSESDTVKRKSAASSVLVSGYVYASQIRIYFLKDLHLLYN